MVDCPCPVCKGPMTGRKISACSGKCRAALSRKRKAEALEERERRVQRLLQEAVRLLGGEAEESP